MMFPSIRLIHSPHSTHFSKSLFRGKKSSFTGSFQMSDLHSVINLKKGRRSHPNQFLKRNVLKILKIISIWRSHRGLHLLKFVREIFLSTLYNFLVCGGSWYICYRELLLLFLCFHFVFFSSNALIQHKNCIRRWISTLGTHHGLTMRMCKIYSR